MSRKLLVSLKSRSHELHLSRTYGITLDQYDLLRKRQGYKCAVCKRPESSFNQRLAVDHDHKTGEIYGLLCNYCNRYRIGRSHDYDIAKAIAEYLQKGTGWFVPLKKRKRR